MNFIKKTKNSYAILRAERKFKKYGMNAKNEIEKLTEKRGFKILEIKRLYLLALVNPKAFEELKMEFAYMNTFKEISLLRKLMENSCGKTKKRVFEYLNEKRQDIIEDLERKKEMLKYLSLGYQIIMPLSISYFSGINPSSLSSSLEHILLSSMLLNRMDFFIKNNKSFLFTKTP